MARHQSKALSSEFKIYKSSDLKIRGAHQSQALSSAEIKIYQSSDLKIRGASISIFLISEFMIFKSSALKIRGDPSVQGPTLAVKD